MPDAEFVRVAFQEETLTLQVFLSLTHGVRDATVRPAVDFLWQLAAHLMVDPVTFGFDIAENPVLELVVKHSVFLRWCKYIHGLLGDTVVPELV